MAWRREKWGKWHKKWSNKEKKSGTITDGKIFIKLWNNEARNDPRKSQGTSDFNQSFYRNFSFQCSPLVLLCGFSWLDFFLYLLQSEFSEGERSVLSLSIFQFCTAFLLNKRLDRSCMKYASPVWRVQAVYLCKISLSKTIHLINFFFCFKFKLLFHPRKVASIALFYCDWNQHCISKSL